MNKKFIIAICISVVAITGICVSSFKNMSSRTITDSSLNKEDDKENISTATNDDIYIGDDIIDCKNLPRNIDMGEYVINFERLELTRTYLVYKIKVIQKEGKYNPIKIFVEPTSSKLVDVGSIAGFTHEELPSENGEIIAGSYEFSRLEQDYADFKFRIQESSGISEYYDRLLPGTYRVKYGEDSQVNKVIEMDSTKFYFDEFLHFDNYDVLNFYVEGSEKDSIEYPDEIIKKFSIDREYGNNIKISREVLEKSNLYGYNASMLEDMTKFKLDKVLPQVAIDSNEVFKGMKKVYKFSCWVNRSEEKFKDVSIKLSLRENSTNTVKLIGEWDEK